MLMKLIDKDALVAEINQRIEDYKSHKIDDSYHDGLIFALEDLRDDFLDTLEVKEVDYKPIDNDFERDAVNFCFDNALNTTPRIAKTIAKHFFELGMRLSNPITASDRGMAEEIIINLKRVEQDYHINLTREMEWLRNQVKKEK